MLKKAGPFGPLFGLCCSMLVIVRFMPFRFLLSVNVAQTD